MLPEQTREELGRIRKELDTAVELWIWGLLTVVWMPWAVWVGGIAITLMFCAYRWSLRTSQVYASLIVAAYDLHRIDLYPALRWPLPQNPAEERIQGEALTQYLWRGSDRNKPMFQLPSNDR